MENLNLHYLQNFNKALVCTFLYNPKEQQLNFSKNLLQMFDIQHINADIWYNVQDPKIQQFLPNIENYQELLVFSENIKVESDIFEDTDFIVVIDGNNYILEGYREGEILHFLMICVESSEQVNLVSTYGLINSKIGVAWAQKVENGYRIFHTTSSKAIYGINLQKKQSRKVFSDEWQSTVDEILTMHPEYITYFEENKRQTALLLAGEVDYIVTDSPWLNTEGNLIWVEDRMTVITRDTDRSADLVVSVTLDITKRKLRELEVDALELKNQQLVTLNEQAIQLTNLLVWRMEYINNEDNVMFMNERFRNTLGLDANEFGYVKLSEFLKTEYPDELGRNSFAVLNEEFDKMLHNQSDVFFGVNIKHQNLKTKEVVYLEHHTTVEERYPDGTIKIIGGYVVNNTDKLKLIEERKSLDLEKEKATRADRLAIKSGRMMLWYLDGTELDSAKYFYGNELLFSKLGLTEYGRNKFRIEEFNRSIYDGDEEGKFLKEKYFDMDDRVENNELDSYDKLLVKHQNITTNEIFYFEHNFEVESRFEDGRLKVRGGYMADVTTEINLKKRNEFLIGHDAVTGLRNRNAFEKYIHSSKMPTMYTIVIADIDGLKLINDAFGHLRGDDAIAFVGNQFQTIFEDCSTIYRIGGDEFAVISREIDELEINRKLDLIRDNIIFFNTKNEIQVGVSIGYEIIKEANTDFNENFTNAENLMYRQKLRDRNSRKSKTMDAVLETLHVKTEETKEHCDRLGSYAKQTLKKLGLSRVSDLDDIEILCQVHDIGKITISEEILSKKGKLTQEEYTKIKTHSEAGYKIIKNIVDSDNIALGVLFHHERVDGKGYPFGLKDEEIPLFAKIVSICDAYDVMITGRKYCKPIKVEEALEEIIRCSGTQFDEKIAKAFVEMIQESFTN